MRQRGEAWLGPSQQGVAEVVETARRGVIDFREAQRVIVKASEVQWRLEGLHSNTQLRLIDSLRGESIYNLANQATKQSCIRCR